MNWRGLLLLLLALPLVARGQQFVGCRMDDGWAETPMVRQVVALEAVGDGRRVWVEVASLGYHDLYVNGMRVGDRVLQPAVSQIDKRALRVAYDVTPYVRQGRNEVLLWLGQGWGRVYGRPAAVEVLVYSRLETPAGAEVELLCRSDSTWQASPSPYAYTGSWQPLQFGGERYDARVKPQWRPAATYEAEDVVVSPQEFVGNRIVDTLQPQSMERLPDSSLLLDFGRVVTGWLSVAFSPTTKEVVTMEYLDHREAVPPHTEKDIFIPDSGCNYQFQNRFHAHAFRYVRIKGACRLQAKALQIGAVDPTSGATFACSDARLNAIHDMVKYTLSCLTFSGYMVDCPHLERMGYGGDGNSSTNTLQTLWDMRDTYRQWMQAWHDALRPDGDLPYAAPAFRTGGGPYWQGFIVKAPWRSYVNYGDSSLICIYYDDMKRWIEYIERQSVEGIVQPWKDTERHAWFLADWLAPEGVDIGGESVLHATSCFVAECLLDMERMARMTGHDADAALFAARRQRVIAAIHRHFYHPATHTYANGTVLDQCYALLLNVMPDSVTAAQVEAQLLRDIHGRYRDHIAAGLMGVPVFTEWCIRERRSDLMATILRQPDYPGYLCMMKDEFGKLNFEGADAVGPKFTTWESWDCGRPGKEDRSRVHNCYNGVGVWFYQALAGIRPDPAQPGYRHFFVDPQPCEGVDWVRASKPTPYGDIRVELRDGSLKVFVPEGSSATLLPGSERERTVGPGEWTVRME